MATSYRPGDDDQQDAGSKDTDSKPDSSGTASPRSESTEDSPTVADKVREESAARNTADSTTTDRTESGKTAGTAAGAGAAGTAATPGRTATIDDTDRTRPISTGTKSKISDDDRLRAEATETRRQAAVELGIAKTLNRASTDFGLLVLRVLSVVMFLHGLKKATGFSGFRETVAGHPFGALAPDLFAILVVVGQLALPIAIFVGLLTRLSGLLLAVMMGFIWVLFPLAAGLIDARTGGINGEGAFLFIVIGLTLFFTGAGRFSLDHAIFGKMATKRATRKAEKRLA